MRPRRGTYKKLLRPHQIAPVRVAPRQGCPQGCPHQLCPANFARQSSPFVAFPGPCPCQGCPHKGVAPARAALRLPFLSPGLPPPALPGEAGPKTHDPSIGGPVQKDQAREALVPAGGRAFRAWPSPFCHMNELGSGIGLEGVLNTVWVKQMVPLPVDPAKCRLKQQQSTRPIPAIGKTRAVSPLDRGPWGVDRSKPEKGGSLGGWGGIRCTEAARPAATPWRGSGLWHFGTP